MKFYVPDAKDSNAIWVGTKKFTEDTMARQYSNRKVFRIDYTHNGKSFTAEVGRFDQDEEKILVILEGDPYVVCTENRGVYRGAPIMVGKHNIQNVVYFEDSEKD